MNLIGCRNKILMMKKMNLKNYKIGENSSEREREREGEKKKEEIKLNKIDIQAYSQYYQ